MWHFLMRVSFIKTSFSIVIDYLGKIIFLQFQSHSCNGLSLRFRLFSCALSTSHLDLSMWYSPLRVTLTKRPAHPPFTHLQAMKRIVLRIRWACRSPTTGNTDNGLESYFGKVGRSQARTCSRTQEVREEGLIQVTAVLKLSLNLSFPSYPLLPDHLLLPSPCPDPHITVVSIDR